ncbi:MAG: UDP-glucose 4-epimerase GalE [Bradymonadaceae bacterium]|nr:UDP-glucose 4-epimerase GalE [Lujinxingiaceae bacterium]
MKVLVTGGAGYIGSHVAFELLDAGHEVVVLDNLVTGVRENVPAQAEFIEGDIADTERVGQIFTKLGAQAVLHFAGSIVVPESVSNPLKYYLNNTSKTRSLLESCTSHGIDKFIFSSTAAVYGIPEHSPVTELTPTVPINPYGRSKLMTEWMLADLAHAHDFRYVALRYFNVAGADARGRTGQSTPEATHLIKVATQTALGRRPFIEVFGTDYPTPDGTCVRDYIHVSDLATAHVMALEHLSAGHASQILNCGYGHGFSVQEVLATVKSASNTDFEVRLAPRRAGDPPELTANSSKLRELFSWTPRFDDLDTIVRTAYAWERGASPPQS